MSARRGTRILLAGVAVAGVAVAVFTARPGTDEARAAENGPGVAFFTTIQNTDMAAAGFGGMRGNGSGTITLTGVSGTVRRALLYWHGPTNSDSSTANASVRFGGTPVTGTHIGFSSDNSWGFANSQAYRADVTPLVTGNGQYPLAEFTKAGVEINGASLLVFFDDGNPANDRDVIVVDGNDSNFANSFDPDAWTMQVSGLDYISGTAGLTLHVSDGQPNFPDDALILNGSTLAPGGPIFQGGSVPGPNGPGTGELWDIKTFDITSFLSPQTKTLTLTTGVNQDYLSLVAAAVDLPAYVADVQLVSKTDEPDPVTVGEELRYTLSIRNNGPDGAFGVSVSDPLPATATPVSAAASQGSCTLAQTVTCGLGVLGAGASATVTIVVRPGTAGDLANTATVSATTPDPNGQNNSAQASTTVAVIREPQQEPTPTPAQDVVVRPVSGVVLVRRRGTNRFVPLTDGQEIPVGSQVDTRRGRVRLTSALPGAKLQTADFYSGLFTIFQRRRDRYVAELRLDGANFGQCPRSQRRTASSQAAKPPKRRLWGNGSGKFRTKGRFSSATIRGTIWLTEDRCDGTLTRVVRGSVAVRDFARRRTVIVGAGRSYLARARRR